MLTATDTPFDYLLSVPRAGRIDIRPFFLYLNVAVSSIALVFIMVMKIMLHMSGQDESAFDAMTQTSQGIDGQDTFSRIVSGKAPYFGLKLTKFAKYD